MSLRNHYIYRAYIAAARNERFAPVTFEEYAWHIGTAGDVVSEGVVTWDESKSIAKTVYKVFGHTGREQFALGIVEQPRWIHNLLICADLRKSYGDISSVPGFDANGNFKRERYNDVIIPEWQGKRIVKLVAHSSRILEKRLQSV